MRSKVLVCGDDTRSFLAIVRSLGRCGSEVHAAPIDFCSPALRSKYIRNIHHLPPYLGNGEAWVTHVAALLDRENFDLIIPCDERTLLPFCSHRARLAPHLIAIPSRQSTEVLFDKFATRQLASICEVPLAEGRLVSGSCSVDEVIRMFGLPIVVKPLRSYSIDLLHTRARVEIVKDRGRLAELLANSRAGQVLLERYFDGASIGLSVLASNGRLLQVFQHRRVHELHGTGSYRVSMTVSPALEEASARMLRALSYTGIAMFEYRVQPKADAWVLIEVNARPWGSMPLASSAGIDFVQMWYDLLVNQVSEQRRQYRIGMYSRNLQLDLSYLIALLTGEDKTSVARLFALLNYFASYGRLCIGAERIDSLAFDDRWPAYFELAQILRSVVTRIESRVPGYRRVRHRNTVSVISKAFRRIDLGQGQITVAFVCQGNICRSPFAAARFTAQVETTQQRLAANSAGLLPVANRQVPVEAENAANAFQVSLSDHRSKVLDRHLALAAALVIVFDDATERSVRCAYPDISTKIIQLGNLLEHPAEIKDPIGRDIEEFLSIYTTIDQSIKTLLAIITEAQKIAHTSKV